MDRDLWTLLAGYLLLVNLAGFLLMGLDKRRARPVSYTHLTLPTTERV